MPHVFELAASGRSKCRGCKQTLPKGELRFGERLPNPFGDGEVTHWFHPQCAAYKRPDAVLEALGDSAQPAGDRESLERIARAGIENERLPRIDGAERSPSGQARCRSCHEPIERGTWRIRLVFHQEGSFSPGGFVHLACGPAYFQTRDLLEPLMRFSGTLTDEDRLELRNTADLRP